MYKILLIPTILVFLFSTVTTAQNFDWAGTIGGTANEYGRSIATDDSGNVFIAGFFQGTADFDPGTGTSNLTSAGGYDIFISKFNTSGNLVWAKSIGSTGSDISYAIATDSFGNVYAAGKFEGTVNFNPAGIYNLTSAGNSDIFVLKLNSSGNFIWAAAMGGKANEQINSIAVDAIGNVYASGVFIDTADFDPGAGVLELINSGGEDFFVLKLNSTGTLAWAKSFGSTGNDRSYAIAIDKAGNSYSTGVFSGTTDFDPGANTVNLTSAGNFDAYVLKLDANGNYLWAKSMGGTSFDFGYGITTDDFGNVITTGYFQGTSDFDPGAGSDVLTSAGNYDIFIHKMDASGNYRWARSMGGASDDRGYAVAADASGNVYVTGYFINIADFDPTAAVLNLNSAGLADFYVHKTDSSGNFIWVAQMGGLNHDFGLAIALDTAGNIYTTGNYEGTADFNPGSSVFNLSPAGGSDVFVLKLKQCNSFGSMNVTVCDLYNSPSGNFIWTTSGTFKDTIPNVAGCDSIITINLNVNKSAAFSINVTACDFYVSPSGNYTWQQSGVYLDTLNTTAGCDSVINIALSIKNSYINVDHRTICSGDSIFLAGSYRKSSGLYGDSLFTVLGCDSILVTSLNVFQNDTTLIQGVNTLISNATTGTYSWLNCDNNYQAVPGETAQDFTPSVSGFYAVEVTANGCTDTSMCYFVSAVGIDESADEQLFKVDIFPNPVVSDLVLQFEKTYKSVEVELISIDGKSVSKAIFNNSKNINIKMNNIAAGVYILKIETEDGSISKKVVKD